MKPYRKEPSYGGIEYYVKAKDVFKLGNGKLVTPQYGFLKENSTLGWLLRKVSLTGMVLRMCLQSIWTGGETFTNAEEYLWVGKNATWRCDMTHSHKRGLLYTV